MTLCVQSLFLPPPEMQTKRSQRRWPHPTSANYPQCMATKAAPSAATSLARRSTHRQPCVEKMLELIAMSLAYPEVYLHTSVQPLCGVLLHGPSSCGKTMLVNTIGGVDDLPPSFFFFAWDAN